jgi:peptidoglycan pentaglycine glycine transferase (the first glycine)
MLDLAERKDVSAKPVGYYKAVLEELGPREEATLILAELDGKAIAGIIALRMGAEGFFFQSAALAPYQNSHVNQFLQWKAMEWCMDHGCTHYDLGGVDDPRVIDESGKMILLPLDPEAMSPEMKGLFAYKKSFGGELVRYAGAFDYVYQPRLYRLWRKMAKVQAEGTDVLHTMQNRVETMRRRGFLGDAQHVRQAVALFWHGLGNHSHKIPG